MPWASSRTCAISDVDATASIAAAGKPQAKYPVSQAMRSTLVAAFAATFYADEHVGTLLAGGCPEDKTQTTSRWLAK